MKHNSSVDLIELKYGGIDLFVRRSEMFVFYATFIADENFKLHIRPGDTVMDFGANIGDFTIKAARELKGRGRLIAIEPSRENVKILRQNLEINNIKDVEIYECAISDHDGFANIYGKGSVDAHIAEGEKERGERVTVHSIDTFLDEINIRNVRNTVVKMDIEGSERYAFESEKFVEKIREISMELHGIENVQRIPEILTQNGFHVSEYRTSDYVRRTFKSIIHSPIDFLRIERRSNYLALKGFLQSLNLKNPIPSLASKELKMVYAVRKI